MNTVMSCAQWSRRRLTLLVVILVAVLGIAGCTSPTAPSLPQPHGAASAAVLAELGITPVCDNTVPGPATPPPGAVTIDPAIDGNLPEQTGANSPGTTFWLAPGTHTFGAGEFLQVAAKDGNTYIGAPGAVIDGRGVNRYAFTTEARDVTIRHLTIRGFNAPRDEGVVNHDSGNGWTIEHNTIQNNAGAALMAGSRQVVRGNCLRDNGQYAMDAYQAGNGIGDLLVEGNEIVGNNTDDWEAKVDGCGCTGGIKFWSVDGAEIRGNWVHDNRGPGLWADTNNNDFLIEGNLIENNDAEGVFYETSYNLVMRNNVLRGNALVKGKEFADRGDSFPVPAVYLSESGGEPRVPARTDKIDIHDNVFENNWSGITAWENADRFCNSPANTSTGTCTRLVKRVPECAQPAISTEPLYSYCRWKTQRVDIHDNTFVHTPSVVGCYQGYAGRMAILSNYGTYPDWSPYQGEVVQQAITHDQQVRWRNNSYIGPWMSVLASADRSYSLAEWQAAPYRQDPGSSFAPGPGKACR